MPSGRAATPSDAPVTIGDLPSKVSRGKDRRRGSTTERTVMMAKIAFVAIDVILFGSRN
jgi:hypothetical protein